MSRLHGRVLAGWLKYTYLLDFPLTHQKHIALLFSTLGLTLHCHPSISPIALYMEVPLTNSLVCTSIGINTVNNEKKLKIFVVMYVFSAALFRFSDSFRWLLYI